MNRIGTGLLVLAMGMVASGGTPAVAQSQSPASTGPVGTPATLPPDGSWRVDLSTEDLQGSGASPDGARAGVFTWTFGQGRATIDVIYGDGGSVSCEADIEPVGDLVRFTYDPAACGGEVDAIRWAVDDEGLHLTLVETNAPFADNRAYLEARPWQRVGTPSEPSAPASPVDGETISLVAVGDSIPFNSPNDCPGCTGSIDRYADALSAATGKPVAIHNLSEHTGLKVADLLWEVTNQSERMEALADADAIVVSIAGNDVPWNIENDACDGPSEDWSKYTDACIAAEVARLSPTYDEVFARIAALRAGKPTILRALDRYNDWVGWPGQDVPPAGVTASIAVVAAWHDMVCGGAEAHGFVCADLATRFNGPDGSQPSGDLLAADYTHPSDQGNEAIAEVLIGLGFGPLAAAGPAAAIDAASPSAYPGEGVPDPSGRIAFGRITRMDDFYGQIVAIYAIDPDGSDLVQLTDGESAYPAWSPDGRQLAFTKAMPDGSFQVAVMAADGSDVRTLTSGPGLSETPTWSPDGSWIAYGHAPALPVDSTWHTSLYRMNADGSDQRLLGQPDTFDTEPKISPDGKEVVFTRLRIEGDSQHQTIWVRDLASGEERAIEAAGDAPEHPNWSPDGKWIIYNVAQWMTTAVPHDQIERIAADGSGQPEVLVRATETEGSFKPWYSPDGSRIVFGCFEAGDDGGCLMDADGSDIQTLIDDPAVHENHFSWGVSAAQP